MCTHSEIILASASPRRKEILEKAGFNITVSPTNIDEPDYNGEIPYQYAMNLAETKCNAHPMAGKDTTILTADTIVVLNNTVLNKPKNNLDAKAMLQSLSNNVHEVITAVCIRKPFEKQTFYETTKVFFLPIPEEAMEYYIEHFSPLDKAGAYGIQDWLGYRFIQKIEGCYYNVMGFPLAKFHQVLNSMR